MKWKKPRFLLTDEWVKRCDTYIQWNITHITHKMEHIWISGGEVDEPRAYYAEWSKSEKEKQILYCILMHTYDHASICRAEEEIQSQRTVRKVFKKLNMENSGSSLKTKNKTTTWPSNPTTGLISWENHNWKWHMYPDVHCSTIYGSQDVETG